MGYRIFSLKATSPLPPTLKQNNINLVELLLSFTVTLLRESKDSRASYISNSFMSQHSSISSVCCMFAFNKVQSLKPYRGLVEIRAYRVNISLACTLLHVLSLFAIFSWATDVAHALFSNREINV